MPFLTQPAIEVDIQWTKNDLEQKVKKLGLQKQQILILINPSQLKGIPKDSAVQGYFPAISSFLKPKHVIMDAALSTVQELGNGFLCECASLQEVNLSPLSNVQKVGDGFLSGCSSLKEVDLSPLSNIQKVRDCFLYGCSSLKEVNLSPLSNVQDVGFNFLFRCSLLKKVDLSSLSNVKKVGNCFLYGCSSLKEVDLSALSNVQEVGGDFLGGCLLTRVILPPSPPECLYRAVRSLPCLVDTHYGIHPVSKNRVDSTSGKCGIQ